MGKRVFGVLRNSRICGGSNGKWGLGFGSAVGVCSLLCAAKKPLPKFEAELGQGSYILPTLPNFFRQEGRVDLGQALQPHNFRFFESSTTDPKLLVLLANSEVAPTDTACGTPGVQLHDPHAHSIGLTKWVSVATGAQDESD